MTHSCKRGAIVLRRYGGVVTALHSWVGDSLHSIRAVVTHYHVSIVKCRLKSTRSDRLVRCPNDTMSRTLGWATVVGASEGGRS